MEYYCVTITNMWWRRTSNQLRFARLSRSVGPFSITVFSGARKHWPICLSQKTTSPCSFVPVATTTVLLCVKTNRYCWSLKEKWREIEAPRISCFDPYLASICAVECEVLWPVAMSALSACVTSLSAFILLTRPALHASSRPFRRRSCRLQSFCNSFFFSLHALPALCANNLILYVTYDVTARA